MNYNAASKHACMVLVGRQVDCDIRPEHPSMSRWHAAFVYGHPPDSKATGVLRSATVSILMCSQLQRVGI